MDLEKVRGPKFLVEDGSVQGSNTWQFAGVVLYDRAMRVAAM